MLDEVDFYRRFESMVDAEARGKKAIGVEYSNDIYFV